MFESIEAALPAEWRGAFRFLAAGVAWIPDWQAVLLGFSVYGNTGPEVAAKWVFVLLPSVLLVIAVWSTMISLYTIPFRSGRGGFLTAILLSWWDVWRMILFYYAGVVRLLVVTAGWLWGLLKLGLKLVVNFIRGTFASPFVFLDWTSRKYFKPGVPWIAFLLILLWSGLEAVVFTLTLRPLITEILADLAGFEPNQAAVTVILWILLFLLIAGSFAAIQALTEAIQGGDVGQIVTMSFVELFVMGFEVLFLYRELVDAITPWLAQQTGYQMGLAGTLLLAGGGWVGVRGMTWFLFGRYGTPALLGVLARQTITRDAETQVAMPEQPDFWSGPITALKGESEWFKKEARQVFELIALPVLQLLAAGVNFAVVAIRSRPVFKLPFRDLDDVLATTPFLHALEGGEGRTRAATPSAPVRSPAEGGVR